MIDAVAILDSFPPQTGGGFLVSGTADDVVDTLKRRREDVVAENDPPPSSADAVDAPAKRPHAAQLRVEPPEGTPISIAVNDPDAPLSSLVHCKLDGGSVRLLLDGARVDLDQSPRQLGLEGGGVLQLFYEQTGGGDAEAMDIDEADTDQQPRRKKRRRVVDSDDEEHEASGRADGGADAAWAAEQLARLARDVLAAANESLAAASDSYCVLSLSGVQVEAGGDGATANRARKKLLFKLHPDKAPEQHKALAEEAFKAVEAAYNTIFPPDEWRADDDWNNSGSRGAADDDASDGEEDEEEDDEESEDEEEEPDAEEDPDDGAEDEQQQQQQAQQAAQQQQTRAQAASARAAQFQQQQQQKVKAPDIADRGLEPWDQMSVAYAPIDASKVPRFAERTKLCTKLRTKIRTLRAVRTGQTSLLPTNENTLLVEAGCSAEKTRQLIAWLKQMWAIDPDMPVLFVTTRQTHADDLAAALKAAGIDGVVNYRDFRVSCAESQRDFLAGARRCIVSFEGLGSVDLELYRGGVVVMDEVRSLAAIPCGGTMEQPGRPSMTVPNTTALWTLCAHAKYHVALDADVSADGAVRDFLRSVASGFDVLHVQLRQAALYRELHYGFTESKRDVQIMKMRQRLALFKARESRKAAMAGPEGQQLRKAALAVIRSWVRIARASDQSEGEELQLPFRDPRSDVRGTAPNWRPVGIGMVRRQDGEAEGNRGLSLRHLFQTFVAPMAMRAARARVAPLIERVFVIAARPSQAHNVAVMADQVGARVACDDGFYSGKGDDTTKRAHFKDTTHAWFWADVVIATSTLSVGVNVRLHFACCFLYTHSGGQSACLRTLLQGIVRVGRDANDPLTDKRIFTLISGSAPTLGAYELTPQPVRHRRVLAELRKAAAEGRKAADAAKAAGDARLDAPVQSVADEEELSETLMSLHAWNLLEAADNRGPQHAIKMLELCKLPTRAWPTRLMEEMTDAEKGELVAFEKDLKENEAVERLKTEDGAVGAMSHPDKYDWFVDTLHQTAMAKGTTLDFQRGEFLGEMEELFTRKGARPEKDCRAHAKEEIYDVVRHLTPDAWSASAWPADGAAYARLRMHIDAVVRRATLLNVPDSELMVIHEAQRRAGCAAHAEVVAPPHLTLERLQAFAAELGVPMNQLLLPTTFTPEQHEWLRYHNRLRAEIGDAGQRQRDAARRARLCELAKKLGANVTKQMTVVKLVAVVLRDVLAMTPPEPLIKDRSCGPGEKKAAHGRFFQVTEPWAVTDEFAAVVPEIQLHLLHPKTRQLHRFRAAAWVDTFEQLNNQTVGDDVPDAMLSDAEEEGGDTDANGGGSGVQRAVDPLRKTFQVDRPQLRKTLAECDALAPDVATAKAQIDERREELHCASQGEGGGFSAAFVLLLHPTKPDVLMAREQRDRFGERRGGGGGGGRQAVVALNPLGGKRKGEETGRQTAAREAWEETAKQLSSAARCGISTDASGAWAGDATRAYVYVYRSPNTRDAGLHELWSKVPATPTLLGVKWVPIASLLDDAWCSQHCHGFSLELIAAARPLLQQAVPGAAGPSGSGNSDANGAAMRQELKELDALHSDLARFEGFSSVARGFDARCEGGGTAGADGWVELADSYKQTVGRRYVDSYGLPRVESEKRWQGAPPRTATLQGGHSDLRAVCCGGKAYDIDCENGDYRLIGSLATQTDNEDLVPAVFDYVADRPTYLKEIGALHDCSEGVAKRLPNVVEYDGPYETWLRNNGLRAPSGGLAAFNGKKCKAFLPSAKCKRDEPNVTRQLHALRAALFEHQRFRAAVEAERGRLQREGLKPQWQHDASLWSTCVVQTSEDAVLGIIEHALFRIGWDVWALIFDGLIIAPSDACTVPDVNEALKAAEDACKKRGWAIKLAEKRLHGKQSEPPKSIANAREALENWKCRQAIDADCE